MDFVGTKFGRGPRELGGSVDLINHFKLWPHHEFFCKRSLPSTISDTPYLHNVVGETKIKKGEGMELDQLFQNTSYVGKKQTDIHPFDLCVLREAFQMRETRPAGLPYVEKGIPTEMLKLSGESKDKKKHKNQINRDKKKNKDHKHRPRPKDSSSIKYEEKVSNGHHDFGPENLQKLQEKKRKFEGSDDLSSIQRRQKTEVNYYYAPVYHPISQLICSFVSPPPSTPNYAAEELKDQSHGHTEDCTLGPRELSILSRNCESFNG